MGGSFDISWRNFPRGRRFRRKTSSAQSSTTTIDSARPSSSLLSASDVRSAASFEVSRGERRLKTPVDGVSPASRSNIEVRNSIARPSESIESPSAFTPPIANVPGRPLPFINLEPTPAESLTSGTSAGNGLIPSSTRDGATVATATIAIELSTIWSQAVDRLAEEDRESIPKPGDGINLVKGFIGEVERKQEECNKKRWFYTNNRGNNVFLLDGLVTQLNKYATIGDLAIQHHPDIVALAWSGFRFLLQVGTSYTQDMQTASESLEYLLRIIFCCEIYERLYLTRKRLGTVQQLNTSLVELYVSILKYLCYIQKYLNKNTGGRVLKSFASDLKVLLKDVQQKESSVLLDTDKVEKEASAIERTEAEKERAEAARAREVATNCDI
ncbi:hypothetical protein DFP73DRAFT_222388 [Morchella snyderi]|nr:hypothetical protein DFP73DRAFT_222388 [Morchella snyderi]